MKHLVLCGTYRSGTTILQKTIDRHPLCSVVHQPALPLFLGLRRLLHDGGFLASNPSDPMGISFLRDRDDHWPSELAIGRYDVAKIANELIELQRRLRAAGEEDALPVTFDELVTKRLTGSTPSQLLDSLFGILAEYRRAPAGSWVGLKEVYVEELLAPLVATDRTLRIVHIIRDPRGVLASRNYPIGASRNPDGLHPLLFVGRMWTTAAQYRRELKARFADRVLLLSFEEMVADTPKTLARVSSFLEIGDEFWSTGPSEFMTEQGGRWRGNSSHPGQSPASQTWRSVLPVEALGAIEWICRHEMTSEGYELSMSSEQALNAFLDYQEDANRLVPWTRRPGLMIDDRIKKELSGRANSVHPTDHPAHWLSRPANP